MLEAKIKEVISFCWVKNQGAFDKIIFILSMLASLLKISVLYEGG